jgi:hypothetical protein
VEKKLSSTVETKYGANGPMKNAKLQTAATRPGGVCGETVKRKTVEREPEEALIPTVKLKGKALRKIGEKEIF